MVPSPSYIQAKNIRAETRLLVFFFYFAISTALSLMLLLAGSRNASQNLQGIYDYFSCEVRGINGDNINPCTFDVDRIEEQAFSIASFVAYTLGPYSTLVYVIPVDKVKDKLGTLKSKSTAHSVSYSRRQEEDAGPGQRIKHIYH